MRDITGRLLDKIPSTKQLILKSAERQPPVCTIVNDWAIDKASYDLLMKFNVDKVRTLRTGLYQVWEKWCKKNNLNPIFSLPNGSLTPLAMPLLFEKKEGRDEWIMKFKKNNVAAYKWPNLPKEILKTINSGSDLQERILCLPIHLSMQTEKLEKFLYNKFIH